jgi:hypothetical protein
MSDAKNLEKHCMAKEKLAKLTAYWSDTEARSKDAHNVYQKEAHSRGDVRHPDDYEDLSESTKEWDRVLVRWVQETLGMEHAIPSTRPQWENTDDSGNTFRMRCEITMPSGRRLRQDWKVDAVLVGTSIQPKKFLLDEIYHTVSNVVHMAINEYMGKNQSEKI